MRMLLMTGGMYTRRVWQSMGKHGQPMGIVRQQRTRLRSWRHICNRRSPRGTRYHRRPSPRREWGIWWRYQDSYIWHEGSPQELDAYISEAQVISCDELDELSTELIQPGHRTICSARVNFEINHKKNHSKFVKAKLDSCGSVSIAHSNLMNERNQTGRKL